ncbi:MAG: hypothetical protein ACHQQS_05710 [Thermoanaerobaculales bacterium]
MRRHQLVAASALAIASVAGVASPTPTTTFWTPMTLDIQPPGMFHLGLDDYFTVGNAAKEGPGSFPTDLTVMELGLPLSSRLQMEVGVDHFGGTNNPWVFNAKVGSPEDGWFKGQPAIELGIFNAGIKTSGPARTDWNVGYLVIGKSLAGLGRISVGPYVGNSAALLSSDGKRENAGFMAAFDRGFAPTTDCQGNSFSRWVFAADYASGKNVIGGGGFGMYYFFTKDISLLTGPVWFNDRGINGSWKWTTQLDINLPLF